VHGEGDARGRHVICVGKDERRLNTWARCISVFANPADGSDAPLPTMGSVISERTPHMSSVSAVQGVTPPTPLQRAKLVEGTRAEEKTESSAQEAR
jgi:hypothetical protein